MKQKSLNGSLSITIFIKNSFHVQQRFNYRRTCPRYWRLSRWKITPFQKKKEWWARLFLSLIWGQQPLKKNSYVDIGQHPHIGLSTLTYLFEGEIRHRDSLGSDQVITAGAVNWMTAGNGVTHTERTPEHLRDNGEHSMHGFQIWAALSKELEQMEPEFHHIEKEQLPKWKENGADFTLIAGEGYGRKSPVPVHSPLFMIEVKTSNETPLQIIDQVKGEIGICVVKGNIMACGEKIEGGNMNVSKTEDACKVTIAPNSHLLLFGGEAFPAERFIFWNFVASSQETIEKAKLRWKNKEFPKVANDDSYIKMPG